MIKCACGRALAECMKSPCLKLKVAMSMGADAVQVWAKGKRR